MILIYKDHGHPWTFEKGWDLLHIKEDTEDKLTEQITKLEKEFWKVWIRDNMGRIKAVMYKPSDATSDWKDESIEE